MTYFDEYEKITSRFSLIDFYFYKQTIVDGSIKEEKIKELLIIDKEDLAVGFKMTITSPFIIESGNFSQIINFHLYFRDFKNKEIRALRNLTFDLNDFKNEEWFKKQPTFKIATNIVSFNSFEKSDNEVDEEYFDFTNKQLCLKIYTSEEKLDDSIILYEHIRNVDSIIIDTVVPIMEVHHD